MTDGTAKVKTLDYKKTSQNTKTILDKKGNVVITVSLPGKNKYLVITIPKEAVDKKVDSLHKAGLGGKLKTKAFMKWLNENKELAVKKYVETKKQSFTFKLTLIKGTDITPVKPEKTPEKPKITMPGIKEKEVKGSKKTVIPEKESKTIKAVQIGVVTKEAAKDGVKFKTVSTIIDLSQVGAGKLKLSVNVSEKELLASDKEFKKTVDKIVDMAMKEAEKKGFKSNYKIDKFSSVNVKTEIKKKIGPALYDKRTEMKKTKKKKIKY